MRALETSEKVSGFLLLHVPDRDVAIDRLIESIDRDRHKLLAWMVRHDKREPPTTETPGSGG